MSKTGMWAVLILIIVLVVGAFWYINQQSKTSQTAMDANQPTTVNGAQQSTTGTQPTQGQNAAATGDASDASLNADLQSADTQIQDANSAGASASSFDDAPVQQTE